MSSGAVRYILAGGGGPGGGLGGFGGPGGGNADRTDWVASACTPVTIPGSAASVYDCSGAA